MLGGGIGIGCDFHGKAREKSGVTFIFPASLLSKSLLAASKEGTAREVLLREAQRLSAHSERVFCITATVMECPFERSFNDQAGRSGGMPQGRRGAGAAINQWTGKSFMTQGAAFGGLGG